MFRYFQSIATLKVDAMSLVDCEVHSSAVDWLTFGRS